MYLGFKPEKGTIWDIVRCSVAYDGRVNLPYRRFTATDHFSKNRPYYGGLDEHLTKDKYQDWLVNQRQSSSSCPGSF